jgi:hypothetical protein
VSGMYWIQTLNGLVLKNKAKTSELENLT